MMAAAISIATRIEKTLFISRYRFFS